MLRRVSSYRGSHPVGNYMFKVNNRNSRTRCEICSKLTITTVLVFLILTLNIFHSLFCVSIVKFGQANAGWVIFYRGIGRQTQSAITCSKLTIETL